VERDYVHALSDFEQASRLDPTSAKYVYNRGVAHFENHQDDLALADFDQALRLNPRDELALFGKAQIYLLRGDEKRARQSFDAADKIAPSDARRQLQEATVYEGAGFYEAAARLLDRVTTASDPTFYNDRCWVRAEWGHELSEALEDCDTALKLKPSVPAAVLDSRGLVNLRLGKLDEALSDYDAALQQAPSQASSLFGKAMAELRKGMAAQAAADIASAEAIEPDIADRFQRFGIHP
jgi:tetratricopeptide (TPR) repeat protein